MSYLITLDLKVALGLSQNPCSTVLSQFDHFTSHHNLFVYSLFDFHGLREWELFVNYVLQFKVP